MKIINSKDKATRLFGHLNHGEDFGHSGNVYIKIAPVTEQSNNTKANAVRLSDGRLGTFSDTTPVSITNAVVTHD